MGLSDADKRLCVVHPSSNVFPEQLLGSFVACQSQMHGDACQCKKHGLLAEVKTRSSHLNNQLAPRIEQDHDLLNKISEISL